MIMPQDVRYVKDTLTYLPSLSRKRKGREKLFGLKGFKNIQVLVHSISTEAHILQILRHKLEYCAIYTPSHITTCMWVHMQPQSSPLYQHRVAYG